MRWKSKAWRNDYEWHRWFAWHPIRLPDDRYTAGKWIWLETVDRVYQGSWGGADKYYRDPHSNSK